MLGLARVYTLHCTAGGYLGGGTCNNLVRFAEKEKSWLVHWRLLSNCGVGVCGLCRQEVPKSGFAAHSLLIIIFTFLKVLESVLCPQWTVCKYGQGVGDE